MLLTSSPCCFGSTACSCSVSMNLGQPPLIVLQQRRGQPDCTAAIALAGSACHTGIKATATSTLASSASCSAGELKRLKVLALVGIRFDCERMLSVLTGLEALSLAGAKLPPQTGNSGVDLQKIFAMSSLRWVAVLISHQDLGWQMSLGLLSHSLLSKRTEMLFCGLHLWKSASRFLRCPQAICGGPQPDSDHCAERACRQLGCTQLYLFCSSGWDLAHMLC